MDYSKLSMPVGEAMFTQRSTRRLKPDPIPMEDIRHVALAFDEGTIVHTGDDIPSSAYVDGLNQRPALQQPVPGVYSALNELNATINKKKGKNALISSVGCKGKKHKEDHHG